MTQQTLLETDAAVAVSRLPRDQAPKHREGEVPGGMATIVRLKLTENERSLPAAILKCV